MSRVAVLIDGGHTRVLARKAGKTYDPEYIAQLAQACLVEGEDLLRVLYYDCPPFKGSVRLPISGLEKTYDHSGQWLKDLARKDLFAVRLGSLKFRGFVPKSIPMGSEPSDDDFKPRFEQKGVDMRIGLDMAVMAQAKSVSRIILCTRDTDCIPAMKHVRRAGIQVVLISWPNSHPAGELLEHCDFNRSIQWP
jgi:uncharacterized LabA/DUF88 family protein